MANQKPNDDPEHGSMLGRILDIAWKQQPALMKVLAVVAAVLVVLAYGAGAIQRTGVMSLLIALFLGGGIVLVVGHLIAAWRGIRPGEGAQGWFWAVRSIVAIMLGVASILAAVLLWENYSDEGVTNRPLTKYLSELGSSCSVKKEMQAVTVQSFAEIPPPPEGIPTPTEGSKTCTFLKELPGIQLATLDLTDNVEIWASFVEIPANATVTLREHNLTIHAIEIRGTGRIVGWPQDVAAAAGSAAGAAGTKGGDSGHLRFDILGQGTGSWTLDLRGQPGGPGQQGAKGATGSPGSRGRSASTGLFDCRRGGGDGGRGGKGFKGGQGGDGGPGGNGGTLKLSQEATRDFVLTTNILHFEASQAPGGDPGKGGDRGNGGPGGRGGSGKGHCGGGHNGPQGEPGEPGDPGTQGQDGDPPKIVSESEDATTTDVSQGPDS